MLRRRGVGIRKVGSGAVARGPEDGNLVPLPNGLWVRLDLRGVESQVLQGSKIKNLDRVNKAQPFSLAAQHIAP